MMEFNLFSISKEGYFSSKYRIENEGDLMYTVKKKNIFLSRYGFYDALGNEVLTLRRRSSLFKIKYELTKSDFHKAYIEQTKGAFKNNFIVDSPTRYYFVEGNFSLKSFTVIEDDKEIAKISRRPFKKKNRYGIAMTLDAETDLILATAIAIEITRKIKQRRKSAG